MKRTVVFCIAALLLAISQTAFAQNQSAESNQKTFLAPGTESDDAVELYPNPSDGHFTVNTKTDYSGNAVLRVFNRSGEEVHNHHVHLKEGKVEVNVKNLNAGIYLMQVEVNGQTYAHYFSKL